MDKISAVPTGRVLVGRRAPATTTSEFAVAEPAATGAAGETGSAGVLGPVALAGLLALQEAGDSGSPAALRDRAARRHGRAVLDDLAALQRSLLGGGADAAILRRLAAGHAAAVEAADPGLRSILAEITLRARIELARYGSV